MKIADKIRQQRRLENITQEELSGLVGVSLKTIQRWENGERSPRIQEIQKLADILSVPVEYLINSNDMSDSTDPQIQLIPTQSRASQETNTGMAILTLENGRKIEAPATPEGYAFLKDLFAMSLAGATPTV